MFNIPITIGQPDQTLNIPLDGISYNIRIYYSSYDDLIKEIVNDGQEGKWYMEINDGIEIKNIALVPGADLFEIYGYQELGALFIVDTTGAKELPTLDGLGDRWSIRYVPVGEREDVLTEAGYL